MGKYDIERKTIDLVVLHHTVTPENYTWKQMSDIGRGRTYKGYDHSYHYDPETGEETFIAYHFLVYKDGTYRRCLPDDAIGWHCGNWEKNTRSVAISCVGNYVDQNPTKKQIETIANIIRPYDRAVGGKLDVLGHKEISATACPGRILDYRQEIVDLVNFEPVKVETDNLENKLKKTQESYDNLKIKYDKLGRENEENVKQTKELTKKLDQTKTTLEQQMKSLDELTKVYNETLDRAAQLSDKVRDLTQELQKTKNKLSVTLEQLADKVKKIKNLEGQIGILENTSTTLLTWRELIALGIEKLQRAVMKK